MVLVRSIGFLISPKENEKRRAMLPEDIAKLKNPNMLYFEKGYGEVLGIKDEEYLNVGANIENRKAILEKDVICDPKIGDGNYLEHLKEGQMIFGWVHAVQNRQVTDILVNNKLKAIAWEDMHEEGRHVFWRNNEIAGEAAVIHAYQLYGKLPYETKVAILGRGNTARGAYRILNGLGADITVYGRNMEELLRKEIGKYDVIVNCILWDTTRKDHIIYRKDLMKMKKNSLIIDVSCDAYKAIETSKITTFTNPIYYVDGIMHYVVDHTPSIFYKTASKDISGVLVKYLDYIVEGKENRDNVLSNAIIIENGDILDEKIIKYQHRKYEQVNIA